VNDLKSSRLVLIGVLSATLAACSSFTQSRSPQGATLFDLDYLSSHVYVAVPLGSSGWVSSSVRKSMRLDFTPALLVIVLAFVLIASVQFASSLPGGERGLLLFEKACLIHSAL
jgi:hypothetical protein